MAHSWSGCHFVLFGTAFSPLHTEWLKSFTLKWTGIWQVTDSSTLGFLWYQAGQTNYSLVQTDRTWMPSSTRIVNSHYLLNTSLSNTAITLNRQFSFKREPTIHVMLFFISNQHLPAILQSVHLKLL